MKFGKKKRLATLPHRSDSVTIVGPLGEHIPALVAECDEDAVVVAPIVRSALPERREDLSCLALEFTDDSGRIRLEGEVELEGAELLRFADLHPVEVIQDREYVRVACSRPVTIGTGNSPTDVLTYSVNLSGGGILLAGPNTLKVGERVPFQLVTTKGQQPIKGMGVVVRAGSDNRPALRFEKISDGDRRRLVHFLFEYMRVERKRGLKEGHGNV